MGLGSTFWAAAGDGVRWMHDWDGYYEWSAASGADPYILTFLHNIKMFQLPFSMSGIAGDKQSAPQHDAGFFYWATSGAAMITYASQHASIAVGGTTTTTGRPAWKEIQYTSSAKMLNGDVPPNVAVVYDGVDYFSGIYQTGFIDKVAKPSGTAKRDAVFWIINPTPGTRYLYHYNPWAWWGTVPAVIADIALKCGLSADFIDQDAFDNAHDAYDLSTGDSPWTTAAGLVTKWEIGCSRRVGEKAIDLIVECARHSRDIYYVNESGKLSVSSFTRPYTLGNFAAFLTLADGIVGAVDWSYDTRYLYTKALVSWGSGVLVSGNGGDINPNNFSVTGGQYNASEDETLSGYLGSRLADYVSHGALAISKFGSLFLKGKEFIQNKAGQPRTGKKTHYPLLLSPHNASGYFPPIRSWYASDSKPRRFITVTQDFRALDWGIGSKVLSVSVTDDGQTIPEMWCIERTYDFDRLTVTSVLMEQPANT